MQCHPSSHDFRHSPVCNECGSPREDRLPQKPYRTRISEDNIETHHRPQWAGAYSVSLVCGGREEGGWYTELLIPLASAMIRSDDDPMIVARTLWDAFSHRDDGREISSVLANEAVCVLWEDTPGEHAVTSVGRYE